MSIESTCTPSCLVTANHISPDPGGRSAFWAMSGLVKMGSGWHTCLLSLATRRIEEAAGACKAPPTPPLEPARYAGGSARTLGLRDLAKSTNSAVQTQRRSNAQKTQSRSSWRSRCNTYAHDYARGQINRFRPEPESFCWDVGAHLRQRW